MAHMFRVPVVRFAAGKSTSSPGPPQVQVSQWDPEDREAGCGVEVEDFALMIVECPKTCWQLGCPWSGDSQRTYAAIHAEDGGNPFFRIVVFGMALI